VVGSDIFEQICREEVKALSYDHATELSEFVFPVSPDCETAEGRLLGTQGFCARGKENMHELRHHVRRTGSFPVVRKDSSTMA